MEYTNNYHLPQWVESDRIMMGDFNEAMANIEEGMSNTATAAAELPYVVGTYTGDDTTTNRTITLGFRPQFVIITGMSRSSSSNEESLGRFGIIGPGRVSSDIAKLNNTGFVVTNSTFTYPKLNIQGYVYSYIAFK